MKVPGKFEVRLKDNHVEFVLQNEKEFKTGGQVQ